STNKVDLEEFDLKSALFRHMNKIKSANRNTANYRLYHAFMEALITDKDAMDKEVAGKVKDHKRKHDSDDDEDDDDDEGPSAGSNQGRSTKRKRSDSAAFGSAQPPPKDDDQSSKKPRSDPELEHSKQSSYDIPMQDEGNDSDMEDTDNAHIPKVSTTTWFKPIPESERPAISEPEWTIPPNDFPEPENNWANTYATTYKVPEENKLQRKTYDIGSLTALFPSLWVEVKREYDISAVYGITHWWFRRKEFYINKHSEPSDREAVRSQMRILSVISVKVGSSLRVSANTYTHTGEYGEIHWESDHLLEQKLRWRGPVLPASRRYLVHVKDKSENNGKVSTEMEAQYGLNPQVLVMKSRTHDAMHNPPSHSKITQKIHVSILTDTKTTLSIDFLTRVSLILEQVGSQLQPPITNAKTHLIESRAKDRPIISLGHVIQ
ncbi:hypothetical protein Tco_0379213, partial [Tanacetum coccineum]